MEDTFCDVQYCSLFIFVYLGLSTLVFLLYFILHCGRSLRLKNFFASDCFCNCCVYDVNAFLIKRF